MQYLGKLAIVPGKEGESEREGDRPYMVGIKKCLKCTVKGTLPIPNHESKCRNPVNEKVYGMDNATLEKSE